MAYEKQTVGFDQVVARVSEWVTPMFSREEYNGCFRKNHYQWKCQKCNNIFQDHVDYGRVPVCKICNPKFISSGELELQEFLTQNQIDFISNDRSVLDGLELDILIPKLKLAIEFNGVYWHSSEKKDHQYHVKKYIQCRNAGIHLIQIFDDEWSKKKNIILSRLLHLIKKSPVIYARRCEIVEIDPKSYKTFVEEKHLQGWASASLLYGLKFNQELVAVMSFSKSRYHKSGYELVRYCSKDAVVGGASRLFKHFVRTINPNEIVSYANRCWSNGNLYKTIGFTDVTVDDYNTGYWYVKNNIRYHRSTFTKKRLVKLYGESDKSESEIMKNHGFVKIHDCGNYKFLWTRV